MKREIIHKTQGGKVTVISFASPQEIQRLAFGRHFGEHPHYRSLYTRRESLVARASQEDTNVVIALSEAETIIGFGVLTYPDPDERWAKLEPKVMMEVKAIEVSRQWRSCGIGKVLAEGMLTHPKVEEKIIYMVGYSWTWDLDGSKMAASQYRKMMLGLFKSYGFVEYKTNEPNVCLSEDNLFMARIGQRVSEKSQDEFKWLCFGFYP